MAYATVAEVKGQIGKLQPDSDAVIDDLITTAAELIDSLCLRPDGFEADSIASARTYPGSGGPIQAIDDCVEISLVEVKASATDSTYESWETTDWIAFTGDNQRPNFQPVSQGKPYTKLMVAPSGDYSTFTSSSFSGHRGFRPSVEQPFAVPTVRITAKWGYATTPPQRVKQATIIQAARWYKRGQGAWEDTLGNAEMGMIMYRKELDPDVVNLLKNGRLIRRAI